jgi:hypothetical protein
MKRRDAPILSMRLTLLVRQPLWGTEPVDASNSLKFEPEGHANNG